MRIHKLAVCAAFVLAVAQAYLDEPGFPINQQMYEEIKSKTD